MMLKIETIEEVLSEYVKKFVPAMLKCEYHLTLVKGGQDYPNLPEQSHLAHIVNGVFGLVQMVKQESRRGEGGLCLDSGARSWADLLGGSWTC